MILKLNDGLSWVLIDGFNRISHQYEDQEKPMAVQENYWDFTIQRDSQRTTKEKPQRIEIWLYKDSEVFRQILAYEPIYILNNEGKTVERI